MVNTLPKNGKNIIQNTESLEARMQPPGFDQEYVIEKEKINEIDVFDQQILSMEAIAIAGEIRDSGNTIVKAREGHVAEIAFQYTEE